MAEQSDEEVNDAMITPSSILEEDPEGLSYLPAVDLAPQPWAPQSSPKRGWAELVLGVRVGWGKGRTQLDRRAFSPRPSSPSIRDM